MLGLNNVSTYITYLTDPNIRDKIKEIPSNLEEFVRSIDESSDKKAIRHTIACVLFIMNKLHKSRKLNNKRTFDEAMKSNSPTPTADNNNTNSNTTTNLHKLSCIPECFRKSSNCAIKTAIAVHMYTYKTSMLRKVILSIMAGEFDHIKDIATYDQKEYAKLNSSKSVHVENNNFIIRSLVSGFVVAGKLLKNKFYVEIAHNIEFKSYIEYIRVMCGQNKLTSVIVVEPLIRRYLKDFVSAKRNKIERERVENELMINPQTTFNFLLKTITQENDDDTSDGEKVKTSSSSKKQEIIFDKNAEYQVYSGPTGPITTEIILQDGKRYLCKILKHCLYDVLAIDDVVLFNDKNWQERLDTLDYRAKIVLNTKIGSDLNEEVQTHNGIFAVSCKQEDQYKHIEINCRNPNKRRKINHTNVVEDNKKG